MSFGAPQYLNLLFLLPLAVLLFWLILRYITKIRTQFQMEQVERFSHFSTRFRYVRLTFLVRSGIRKFDSGCG